MDEFNTKRISIFLLFLVAGFFLMPDFGFSITGNTAPQSSQIRIWQGKSDSIYNIIKDWTTVSCSSGNNPYTCTYYIGTPSDPAFCSYEGNYYFQWRFLGKNYEGTQDVWYYTDSSGNYVVRTSSSSSGVFMYNINYDVDSNDCECKMGPGRFNIGGEISGCCGDDANEYVLGGAEDNTLDPYLISSDSKACCNSWTDCVYNNECYQSDRQGPDVDQDGDYDWCGYPGTWRDCNTDAQCGGGAIFGEYEVCRSNDCKVACYNQPCVAGYSECVDEILGETLYCMNSTSSASQSSHVENPTGGNTNERYCHQDEYYEPGVGCQPKYGEDICYNYLDPSLCGTGNTASVVDCNLVGKYCSFDTGKVENIQVIKSTDAPLQVVGTGPMSPTTTGGCIETDGGDKPKEWGCVYIMNAENNIDDDFQAVGGYIGCDQVSNGKLIEFYCSGGEILAKEYTCTVRGTDVFTSYCFETPSGSKRIDPPTRKTPKKSCIPDCDGKECGSDGCGGSCGSCDSGEICSNGQCVASCTPIKDCGHVECGTISDGCGGTIYCGSCDPLEVCENGICVPGGGPTPPIKPPGYGLT